MHLLGRGCVTLSRSWGRGSTSPHCKL